jgi:hypothetical protein
VWRLGGGCRFLGLTVGAVQSNTSIEVAQAAYGCHVTYVTGQELCFNYLKDNTAQTASELVCVWLCVCVCVCVCVSRRVCGCPYVPGCCSLSFHAFDSACQNCSSRFQRSLLMQQR